MNKIKCFNCGVTNWATAENCVRCKNKLEFHAAESFNYVHPPTNTTNLNYESTGDSFLRSPVFIFFAALFSLAFVYFFLLKSSPVTSSNTTSGDSNISTNSQTISVANPPAGINVTPPKIENFVMLAKKEIMALNFVKFSTQQQISTPPVSTEGLTPKGKVHFEIDEEARKKIGACDGRFNDCEEILERKKTQIRDERAARERFFNQATTTHCPPQIQEDIKLSEPGSYSKFDDKIFYSVNVSANGLVGVEQNNQCVYKQSVGGLGAKIYLKWQNSSYGLSGWQPSNQIEVQTLSLEHQKKKKEMADKIREDKKSKRWNFGQ